MEPKESMMVKTNAMATDPTKEFIATDWAFLEFRRSTISRLQ